MITSGSDGQDAEEGDWKWVRKLGPGAWRRARVSAAMFGMHLDAVTTVLQ